MSTQPIDVFTLALSVEGTFRDALTTYVIAYVACENDYQRSLIRDRLSDQGEHMRRSDNGWPTRESRMLEADVLEAVFDVLKRHSEAEASKAQEVTP